MNDFIAFSSSDKMVELIKDNYRLLQVLSRFGIPMGFGDKTVGEVCRRNNVDINTFIAVINQMIDETRGTNENESISLPSLLEFLRKSHAYFLEFCLPAIRRKLLDAIKLNNEDISFLIIKLFDEYVSEIKAHMDEEEKTLFPYVVALCNGELEKRSAVVTYSEHHEDVGSKLKELKNIIIKYCPDDSKMNHLNAALYDIYRCEEELTGHCRVEDNLLIPAIKKLENKELF